MTNSATTNPSDNSSMGAILIACLFSAIGIACWNVMPVVISAAAEKFSLNAQQMGLLGSSLLGGWLIAAIACFMFMHQINRRWVISVGALFAIIGMWSSNYVDSTGLLFLTWGIAGFGMALIYCVSISLVVELSQVEKAFGYKVISEVFSGAVLLYVFPVFIVVTWLYAGASIGLGLVYLSSVFFLYWVKPFPKDHQASSNSSIAINASPTAWLALAGLLLFLIGITGLWAFIDKIGTDVGVVPEQMGVVLAILKVVGGAAGFTAAILGANYGLRWPHVVGFVSIFIAVLFLYSATGVVSFAIGSWIWEFGFSLGIAYQAAAVSRLDPSNRLIMLMPSCIGLSGVIGPAVAGYLKTDSYLGVYLFAIVCALIPAIVFFWAMSPKRLSLSGAENTT